MKQRLNKILIILILILIIFFLFCFFFKYFIFKSSDERYSNKFYNVEFNSSKLNLTSDYNYLIKSGFKENLNNSDNSINQVKIIEYVNYLDHFSKKYHNKIFPKIKSDFNISYEIRQFPDTRKFRNSFNASNFVLCAAEQGKFKEANNYLLNMKLDFNSKKIELISKDIGLNYSKINICMKSEKFGPLIYNDIKDGNKDGIKILPTIIIENNLGEKNIIQGLKPYFFIKKEIEFFQKIKN